MIVSAAILKDGQVHVGRRHHNIINDANPRGSLKGGIQGFVTDTGTFLNREEAAAHALQCGQITELKFQPRELFSEDLY